MRRGLAAFAAALLAAVALIAAASADAKTSKSLRIDVLSNRADVISGGDALVAIGIPNGVQPSNVLVRLRGKNVTGKFAVRPNGRFEALLTGLRVGNNTITASALGANAAHLTLINHANGGPTLSGPQVKPWICKNGSKSPKCDQQPTFSYECMTLTGFQSCDPSSPPPGTESTTTQTGVTVPFIIRIETGYQDRDQYQIAVLWQAGKPWTAWSPQAQFNHKLLITHGASCGIDHQSSTAPSVTGDTAGVPGAPSVSSSSPTTALGEGFAVMSTALDNAGHNCNLVTQAESLIMAKEHLIEHYGTLRFTIGTGCSGGSLVQQQVANAYPGIYQGILPQCSFPDAWSTGQQLAAYHFTRGYFEHPEKWGPGIAWTPDEIADVEGHPNHGNAIIFDTVYWNSLANPSGGCAGVTTAQMYNAQTNPGGVRCTLADYMINVFGHRPASVWTKNEKKIGHGFAGLPIGDVGVQFGLQALQAGQITPAQFVDLNDKIGGADIDLNYTHARSDATQPALRNDYRSGAVNETNNLTSVAIIDLRGPDPGAFHDAYRSWTIRARLEHAEGHFPRNHVIWFGEAPLIGDPTYTTLGLMAEDRWLTAVEGDHRNISLSAKVQQDRPADVHDQCSNISGVQQITLPDGDEVCQNANVQTRYATPAMVAGEDIRTDIEKCKLEKIRRESYYPNEFTDSEWSTLKKVFPTGVCDWSDGGVSKQGTFPWLTYQKNAAGTHVVYGGRSLGAAPGGSGDGWTSPVFGVWRKGEKGFAGT
ncbi:MAG: hypothetical protein JOZ25_11005 [Actinobacteria bacterium]|nr:hypothetical protein [Actinomycetota bacterium]